MGNNKKSKGEYTHGFIARYGRERLRYLLREISNGSSGQQLAEEFQVSRERIRQWKITFGVLSSEYLLFPEGSGEPEAIRRERVKQNFIRVYSFEKYLYLIENLSKRTSIQSLADYFNVSRLRIKQWQNTFGQVKSTYTIFPEVIAMLKNNDPDPDLSFA